MPDRNHAPSAQPRRRRLRGTSTRRHRRTRAREPSADDTADPRLELVLAQAHRGLTQQQAALDNLRARAGTLVAAASLVSSFFGAAALSDQDRPPSTHWVLLAFACLFVVLVAAISIVWPYQWRWGTAVRRLLGDSVEADPPAPIDEMRRSLAWYMQVDTDSNSKKLDCLWWCLRIALVAMAAEVVFWALAFWAR